MSDRARVWAWRLAILVVLLVAWEWLTGIKAISRTPGLYWIDPFFISRPSLIAKRFAHLASDQVRLSIWQMALSTVQSTLWGFLVGVSTGFAAGLVLGRNDRLASILDPYIVAFNSLPRIALVPLITMIFGFGLLAKIVLAWTIVFFIVFFNTFQGARSVDADLIHSARFLGGSDRQIMRTVIVPSALAWTFASLTPSISFALIGVVVGEFLGGESGGGLGYLIIQSLGTLNAADMMVALIALGVIGIAMALGIKQIEKRLLRWRPEYREPDVKRWVWLTAGLLVLLGLVGLGTARLVGRRGSRASALDRRGDRVAGGVDPVGVRRRAGRALRRAGAIRRHAVHDRRGARRHLAVSDLRAQGTGAGARGIRGGPAGLARRRPGPERSARPMKTREDAQITSLASHRGAFFRVLQQTARSQVAVMTIAAGADGGPGRGARRRSDRLRHRGRGHPARRHARAPRSGRHTRHDPRSHASPRPQSRVGAALLPDRLRPAGVLVSRARGRVAERSS